MTAVEEVVAGAHAIAAGGLVISTAGNVSVRSDDHVVITGGGVQLHRVSAETCVTLSSDGEILDGSVRPSSEKQLHLDVYAATGGRAVVHTHSHFATVMSTLVERVPVAHYATAVFGGQLRVAPYARFGSAELAANVAAALDDRTGALMGNHGAVVTADTVEAAVERAFLLEWLCSVAYHAMVAGDPRLIDEAELQAVAVKSKALRYGEVQTR